MSEETPKAKREHNFPKFSKKTNAIDPVTGLPVFDEKSTATAELNIPEGATKRSTLLFWILRAILPPKTDTVMLGGKEKEIDKFTNVSGLLLAPPAGYTKRAGQWWGQSADFYDMVKENFDTQSKETQWKTLVFALENKTDRSGGGGKRKGNIGQSDIDELNDAW